MNDDLWRWGLAANHRCAVIFPDTAWLQKYAGCFIKPIAAQIPPLEIPIQWVGNGAWELTHLSNTPGMALILKDGLKKKNHWYCQKS